MQKEQIKEMIRLYETGLSCGAIAKIFGYKTPKSINEKLVKAGIKIRTSQNQHSQDKSYSDDIFKSIDCEWKAYYLGLLLTDGWITDRSKGFVSDIIGLGLTDEDCINYLSLCTGKSVQYVSKSSSRSIGPSGKLINQNKINTYK